MEIVNYKCPSCSAALMYNVEVKAWRCDYCKKEFHVDDLLEIEKEFEKVEAYETMDADEYTCSSCGAKIITGENTTATFCVYCGNTAIIKNRLTGVLKPHYIIPFKLTKELAIEEFLKLKWFSPFASRIFFKKHNIEKMTPVYIPFWLFDYSGYGKMDAVVKEISYGNVVEEHKRKLYLTDKKRFVYEVECKGSINFENVPADASKQYNDKVMDSIEPFDFSELIDFSPAYLSGFFAEKYDISKKIVDKRVEKRIIGSFEECLKDKAYQRYEPISFSQPQISLKRRAEKYVLLPVWLVNIDYKGKKRLFAINGQNGRIVGNIPISLLKLFLWFLGIFIFILAVMIFINSVVSVYLMV